MSADTGTTDFARYLQQWQSRACEELQRRLPPATQAPQRLHAAMRYAVLGGGKRLRPVLVYATGKALGLAESALDGAACAVELIHAYSLVHDDLPAMDNDDMRRGQPTCHKAFDEATAILAGDALQVLAFEILTQDPTVPSAALRLQLIEILSRASGTQGMAGGQALDLASAGSPLALADVIQMHRWKTGALIRASVMMAAACAQPLAPQISHALEQFSEAVGLAFQIQDDLLDIEGDPTLLGKAVGADQAHAKPTYPAIAGIDAARARVAELHAQALAHLTMLGEAARPLQQLSDWLVLRRH